MPKTGTRQKFRRGVPVKPRVYQHLYRCECLSLSPSLSPSLSLSLFSLSLSLSLSLYDLRGGVHRTMGEGSESRLTLLTYEEHSKIDLAVVEEILLHQKGENWERINDDLYRWSEREQNKSRPQTKGAYQVRGSRRKNKQPREKDEHLILHSAFKANFGGSRNNRRGGSGRNAGRRHRFRRGIVTGSSVLPTNRHRKMVCVSECRTYIAHSSQLCPRTKLAVVLRLRVETSSHNLPLNSNINHFAFFPSWVKQELLHYVFIMRCCPVTNGIVSILFDKYLFRQEFPRKKVTCCSADINDTSCGPLATPILAFNERNYL
eukprot:sb/3466910/